MTTHETILALLERADDALTCWAIEWLALDLAEVWEDLDDDERDALVECGAVEEVDPTVECESAESWQDDWRTESAAAWPSYTLSITALGMPPMAVDGWHIVGLLGPDGNRRSQEWDSADDDGAYSGLPRMNSRDEWELDAGFGQDGGGLVPCWRGETGWQTLDRRALESAILSAAASADHGSEPTWEDVPESDMEDHETVYILRDYRVEEQHTRTGGVAGQDVERDYDTGYYGRYSRPECQYHATAWSHELADGETWETEREAIADLSTYSQTEAAYRTEDEAKAALARLVDERLDECEPLPGMVYARDDDGLYLAPEESEDGDDRYHLDADQTAGVCIGGDWLAVVDDVREALGTRATLGACRHWQEEMDAIIAERDPWVMVEHSLAGGNCRSETDRFRSRLAETLGATGDIGAVRAHTILGIRDDSFTRRACRVAANRTR